MESQRFYSHGKLLITGEYLVLDGAEALAIPCQFGQSLEVSPTAYKPSTWKSYDHDLQCWLNFSFEIQEVLSSTYKAETEVQTRLIEILRALHQLNPNALSSNFKFSTRLEFPRNWGLGTSSTLISNLSQWAGVDPYELLRLTFGGSGYDIACALSSSALTYQLQGNQPKVEAAIYPEALKPFTYFVYLDEKQNSREAIKRYRSTAPKDKKVLVAKVNQLTQSFENASSLQEGQTILDEHEQLLAKVLGIPPIKSKRFSDFEGSVKSLGAWGGDFVMVMSKENPATYFKRKGYYTMLAYSEMAL